MTGSASAPPLPLAPSARGAEAARRIGSVLFRSIYRVRVHGADLVPSAGPAIVAGNHTAILDGPLLVSVVPRHVNVLVKQEMFDGPLGPLLRMFGEIPVERHQTDRRAMRSALAVLERGDLLGVFPEGTRGAGDFAAVEAGLAYLALASGAMVVPAAVLGVRRPGAGVDAWPSPTTRLDVVFGAPFVVEVGTGPRRAALREASEQVRNALAAHVVRACALTGQTLPPTR